MLFSNTEEIRCDCHLFNESRYEKEYAWLYHNFKKISYLCKIYEVFYGESSSKHGGSMDHGHIKLLSLQVVW